MRLLLGLDHLAERRAVLALAQRAARHRANGIDGFDTELRFNSPLHVRHLQNLIDLQRDNTFSYSGRTNTGEGRFTSGECPIFLTSSGFYGNVKANAKFDWANAPMPYYPDVAGAPQNATLGGARSG